MTRIAIAIWTVSFAVSAVGEEDVGVPPTLRVYEEPGESERAKGMLNRLVSKWRSQAAARRERELAALESPDDWRDRQRRTRDRLVEFFGDFGPKCPLNAKIVGRLERPDYVIEKLIFESQPGYHCTANFYVPKHRKFPLPGVIFTCGHAPEGKASRLYHEACLGLVLKGYVILGLDPTGQGERSEYFDPETGKHLVPLTVAQHHYLARPSWLVGRSLAGYRTWDCIRAVDYLVSRPEVDPEEIAAVGNSGGGQMALLITAADLRVRACAAAHPGGSMENTYLIGQGVIDREILSLIPPRPCAMVVGEASGEEPGHRRKLDDMLRFYEGLGVEKNRGQMFIVQGAHDMKKPKREACYAWLNKWFNRESEGGKEPPLEPYAVEDLNCTETGYVLRDVGGESGQTINAKLAEKLRPPRPVPADRESLDALRRQLKTAVASRIGMTIPKERAIPGCTARGRFETDAFVAEKLVLRSEEDIKLPSLLLLPKKADPHAAVVLHAAELGKPTATNRSSLALDLASKGYVVLSVDVRGAGETDPRIRSKLRPLTHYDPSQFRFDSCAVCAAYEKTTMLAMRAYDVIRAMDYLAARSDLSGRPVVLLGEGLGGVWVLAAAAMDARPGGVVCVKTVPSYKLIVGSQYYKTRDYFWVNGALEDFDLPDLIGLVAPRPTVLIDPADALLEPLGQQRCTTLCQWPENVYKVFQTPGRLRIVRAVEGTEKSVAERVAAELESLFQVGLSKIVREGPKGPESP